MNIQRIYGHHGLVSGGRNRFRDRRPGAGLSRQTQALNPSGIFGAERGDLLRYMSRSAA